MEPTSKPKIKSKTLWYNSVISVLVITAGVVMLYAPQIITDDRKLAISMMVLTLITTFGNKWLRQYKTTTKLE